jgi:Protein of unknown function (DUF3224)
VGIVWVTEYIRATEMILMTTATGTLQLTGWDEAPFATLASGGKLTKASVTGTFSGEIAGDATVEWLMAYADDAHATFVGVQRLVGELGGRSGEFTVTMTGSYQDGEARAAWTVVPGTGSGELAGITGDGQFVAASGGEASGTVTYDLAAG